MIFLYIILSVLYRPMCLTCLTVNQTQCIYPNQTMKLSVYPLAHNNLPFKTWFRQNIGWQEKLNASLPGWFDDFFFLSGNKIIDALWWTDNVTHDDWYKIKNNNRKRRDKTNYRSFSDCVLWVVRWPIKCVLFTNRLYSNRCLATSNRLLVTLFLFSSNDAL